MKSRLRSYPVGVGRACSAEPPPATASLSVEDVKGDHRRVRAGGRTVVGDRGGVHVADGHVIAEELHGSDPVAGLVVGQRTRERGPSRLDHRLGPGDLGTVDSYGPAALAEVRRKQLGILGVERLFVIPITASMAAMSLVRSVMRATVRSQPDLRSSAQSTPVTPLLGFAPWTSPTRRRTKRSARSWRPGSTTTCPTSPSRARSASTIPTPPSARWLGARHGSSDFTRVAGRRSTGPWSGAGGRPPPCRTSSTPR